MKTYLKTALVVVGTLIFICILWFLSHDKNIAMLQPAGAIAQAERNLMYLAAILMLGVAVPVFLLTGIIAWRYRASNTRAKYLPNWEHNTVEEAIWWAIPCIIVVILASFTWKSSHELDPFRPLPGEVQVIQVVSLNWKWLFVYPNEGIATVNFLEIPVGRPVEFHITADSPMNSFWVPQLGGQIYAMTGMVTQLHLIADKAGEYSGASANISGRGFSGMNFKVKAVPPEEFLAWIASTSANTSVLDKSAYETLAKPSEREPVRYYGEVEDGLFQKILERYGSHMPAEKHMHL